MPKEGKPKSGIAPYAHLLSLGIEMAAAMVIPIFIGLYLEDYFPSIKSYGVIGGALFGFISSFWLVYKRVMLNNK